MIEKPNNGDGLLVIDNLHHDPVPLVYAHNKYVSYLEDAYGEQWVIVGDRKTGEITVYSGGNGWKSFPISLSNLVPDVMLGETEKIWMINCVAALYNIPFETIYARFTRQSERK
jgi:hypothetical protein